MNCEPIECPICFDSIGEKNNIITECGHKFHASCLMTNITRNGFGCPCCRAVMAEEPNDYTDVDDGTGTEVDDDGTEIDEIFDDDALRGLRLLTNLLEGNEHDQEDVVAEFQYVQREEEQETLPIPTLDIVTARLRAQGVTYEQLVANALMDHDEYEDEMDELDRVTGDLWGNLRTIISNFRPEPVAVAAEEPVVAAEEPVVAAEEPVVAARRGLTLSDLSDCLEDEFEFEEGCHTTENWRDTILNEVDVLWSDIEGIDFQAINKLWSNEDVDFQAQPKIPMIHV